MGRRPPGARRHRHDRHDRCRPAGHGLLPRVTGREEGRRDAARRDHDIRRRRPYGCRTHGTAAHTDGSGSLLHPEHHPCHNGADGNRPGSHRRRSADSGSHGATGCTDGPGSLLRPEHHSCHNGANGNRPRSHRRHPGDSDLHGSGSRRRNQLPRRTSRSDSLRGRCGRNRAHPRPRRRLPGSRCPHGLTSCTSGPNALRARRGGNRTHPRSHHRHPDNCCPHGSRDFSLHSATSRSSPRIQLPPRRTSRPGSPRCLRAAHRPHSRSRRRLPGNSDLHGANACRSIDPGPRRRPGHPGGARPPRRPRPATSRTSRPASPNSRRHLGRCAYPRRPGSRRRAPRSGRLGPSAASGRRRSSVAAVVPAGRTGPRPAVDRPRARPAATGSPARCGPIRIPAATHPTVTTGQRPAHPVAG